MAESIAHLTQCQSEKPLPKALNSKAITLLPCLWSERLYSAAGRLGGLGLEFVELLPVGRSDLFGILEWLSRSS